MDPNQTKLITLDSELTGEDILVEIDKALETYTEGLSVYSTIKHAVKYDRHYHNHSLDFLARHGKFTLVSAESLNEFNRGIQQTAALEGVVDILKQTGKHIKDLIIKLYNYLKNTYNFFFNDLVKARRLLEQAKKLIPANPVHIDIPIDEISSQRLLKLCYYGGLHHTVSDTIKDLTTRVNILKDEFDNRLPRAIQTMIDAQKGTYGDLFDNPTLLDQWLTGLINTFMPFDPLLTHDKVTRNGKDIEIAKIIATANKGQGVMAFVSTAYPGNYRITSIVPQSIGEDFATLYSKYRGHDYIDKPLVVLLRELTANFRLDTDGTGHKTLFINDLLNVKFEFSNPDKDRDSNIQYPDTLKSMTSIEFRESVNNLDTLITKLEALKSAVSRVSRAAKDLTENFDKIDFNKIDQDTVDNTEFLSHIDLIRRASFKALSNINMPYTSVITHAAKCASILSHFTYGEALRYKAFIEKVSADRLLV